MYSKQAVPPPISPCVGATWTDGRCSVSAQCADATTRVLPRTMMMMMSVFIPPWQVRGRDSRRRRASHAGTRARDADGQALPQPAAGAVNESNRIGKRVAFFFIFFLCFDQSCPSLVPTSSPAARGEPSWSGLWGKTCCYIHIYVLAGGLLWKHHLFFHQILMFDS